MSSIQAYKQEIRKILAIGLPIMGTQIAQASMGFVDTLMAGRYGAVDLAGVALGTSLWIAVFVLFGGVLMATTAMVAHLIGGNQSEKIPNQLVQSAWLGVIVSILGVALLVNLGPFMSLFNVADNVLPITQDYLFAFAMGFPAMMGFQILRSAFEGIARPRSILAIVLFGLIINIPLNYIFMYGKFGLPEMGGVGCGWATAIVSCTIFLVALIWWFSQRYAQYRQGHINWSPDKKVCLETLKVGVPSGLMLFMEVSMFSMVAVLIARLGAIEVAGHQVTLNFTGLLFMVPLSISLALSVRVGQLAGGKLMEQAFFAAKAGIYLCLSFAIISASGMLLFNDEIARLYTTDQQVIALASSLMILAAAFQFSDAIQVCCAGALRGYKDTVVPMSLTIVAYWLVGLPLGVLLGLTDWWGEPMGASGFWYGIIAGLSAAAILLLIRFQKHRPSFAS